MGTYVLQFEDAVNPATVDGIFRAMSNTKRRHLLAYLAASRESVTYDELVEYLSSTISPRGEIADPADPDEIAVMLHHRHLPELEASGLVEIFEGPTGRTVRGTDLLDQVTTEVESLHPDADG